MQLVGNEERLLAAILRRGTRRTRPGLPAARQVNVLGRPVVADALDLAVHVGVHVVAPVAHHERDVLERVARLLLLGRQTADER